MVICKYCEVSTDRYVNGKKCRDCYNAYMRVYNLARYHTRRAEAIAAMGSKCVDCGATEYLQFDHVNRFEKTMDVSTKWWNYSKFADELKKCVLRCQPCHIIKTRSELTVGHGNGAVGVRGCKCEPCLDRRRIYSRKYKKKKKLAGIA